MCEHPSRAFVAAQQVAANKFRDVAVTTTLIVSDQLLADYVRFWRIAQRS
jgi:hypothetical protein